MTPPELLIQKILQMVSDGSPKRRIADYMRELYVIPKRTPLQIRPQGSSLESRLEEVSFQEVV